MTAELGVGLTCQPNDPGVTEFAASNLDLVRVLEVDSAGLSIPALDGKGGFRIDEEALERIRRIPCARVLRAGGLSIGGSRLPDRTSLGTLRDMASALEASWICEPLAFHRARGDGREFECLLPLPPRQTIGGARMAAHSVRSAAKDLRTPFAVETSVNYLRPRGDEVRDGEFLSEVVEDAECEIVLDLHRVWINNRNGREPFEEFLAHLPAERVIALRLSSGFERSGFQIDSRSGAISRELLEIALATVPRLPNLAAILFEIAPAYLPRLGAEGLRAQLRTLQYLWNERRRGGGIGAGTPMPSRSRWKRDRSFSAREWEDALGCLVVGRGACGALAEELASDRGVSFLRQLLSEERTRMVTKTLSLTSRLVSAAEGPAFLRSLLEGYWKKEAPQRFASLEALGFAEHVAGLSLEIPYLAEVVEYERALIRSMLDGEHRVVSFQHDPRVVLRALARGRLPSSARTGSFEIAIDSSNSGPRLAGAVAPTIGTCSGTKVIA